MAGEDLEVLEEVVIGLLDPTDPEFEIEVVEISVKRRTIVVLVNAPKEIEPKRFRFPLDETVGAAAKVAAEAFGYQAGNPSFQKKDEVVLDRNLTLEAAHVHNREPLELVDAGGGV
jgi:hypothetical protein